MWEVVTVDAASLEDVAAPRRVVDTCPACRRRARLVERAVTRAAEGWNPWRGRAVERAVLQCAKCRACFALPEQGLPAWEEAPETRERHLTLARLRARWTAASQEAARWQRRSELAIRSGDLALAEEARRQASRYEGDAHVLRGEIERLGGELPTAPRPDPAEAKLDEELAALREKAAAKRAAEAPDASPAPPTDATTADDELAALKQKMARREDAPAQGPAQPPAPPASEAPAGGDGDDELAALKRKLKSR